MKNLAVFTAMIMATVSVNSANYITIGDDVRVHPRYLGGYFQMTCCMEIDGMVDDWQIVATYPQGVMVKLVSGIVPLDGMTIGYTDRFGNEQTYDAPLQVSVAYSTISSHIGVQGYWDYDNDGYYEPYGSAKWMPGIYEMFEMNLYVSPDFREGNIIFDGTLTSGSDQRGAVLQGVRFYKPCRLWVGYMPGDVTGNDKINIDDVTALIDYLLTGEGLDEFGVKAADANLNNETNISDVTYIINVLLG